MIKNRKRVIHTKRDRTNTAVNILNESLISPSPTVSSPAFHYQRNMDKSIIQRVDDGELTPWSIDDIDKEENLYNIAVKK